MEKISVSFISHGGLPEILAHANFASHFQHKFEEHNLEIAFYAPDKPFYKTLFYGQQRDVGIIPKPISATIDNTETVVELGLYPAPVNISKKLLNEAKPVGELLNYWKEYVFGNKLRSYLFQHPQCNWNVIQNAIINGRNFINMLDVDNRLEISGSAILPIYPLKQPIETLNHFGIGLREYIAIYHNEPIQPGKSTNIWPYEYYNQLAQLLKQNFPNLILVQIGVAKTAMPCIKGVDLDLRGKTDLEDLKVILKNARLHIESEGGFSLMRRALRGGPCAVFFGPTPLAFAGYQGDINLRSNICAQACARLTDDWLINCAAGHDKPRCMYELTPEIAFIKIKNFMENGRQVQYLHPGLSKAATEIGMAFNKNWLDNFLQDKVLLNFEIGEMKLASLMRQSRLALQKYKRNKNNMRGTLDYNDPADNYCSHSDSQYIIMNGRTDEIIYEHCDLPLLYKQYGYNYPIQTLKLWYSQK